MKDEPLSVVIIAKNEAQRIAGCLQSIGDWADEIIVIDDESFDATREIAVQLGATVHVRKMDIEGRHRNWAYTKAKNQWVLSVDADERLTEPLKKEIDLILPITKHACFDIPMRTYIGDYWIRWGGWYSGSKVKLFKKNLFKYEEVEVHPRVFIDGSVGHLKGDVVHYSYRDWSDFMDKTNKQTTLEAIKWYKLSLTDPKKARHKMNTVHALWRVADRFIRTYFFKRGYRDAFVGFMVAYFASLYQIMSYSKYRQLTSQKRKNV